MPELPEVETIRRGLEKAIRGRTIEKAEVRRPDIRLPITPGFAHAVRGRKICAVRRRAKYLLIELEGGKVILLHLGMSGRILIRDKEPRAYEKHDHVVLHLSGKNKSPSRRREGDIILIFNDPRRFGLALLMDKSALKAHKLLALLGMEPLEKKFNADSLRKALSGRKQAIKTALMDQRLVVGVGNIYASEALFAARIDPRKAAGRITRGECARLVESVKKVLEAAIASGGSTLRDYVRSDGEPGYFQHHFKVYGRTGKPCFVCRMLIKKTAMSGRSTFFCPRCQKEEKH